jgi:hypothetical protein
MRRAADFASHAIFFVAWGRIGFSTAKSGPEKRFRQGSARILAEPAGC